jgi:hypothetical protein
MSHKEAQKAQKAQKRAVSDEELAAEMERERAELEETWARPRLCSSCLVESKRR